MWLKFSKMHCAGLDLVLIDLITQTGYLRRELIRELGLRHKGIGFSQLMIIEQPKDAEIDFYFRIFNADGSDAVIDSNAVRCIMRFVVQQQLTGKSRIKVQSQNYCYELALFGRQDVQVSFKPAPTLLTSLDKLAWTRLQENAQASTVLALEDHDLELSWHEEQMQIKGPVDTVYEGRINL
ncbi:MAG: hypothetical protein RL217_427 [Pseudomonadota bacterium]|jgi:diaminopimelate epimerase